MIRSKVKACEVGVKKTVDLIKKCLYFMNGLPFIVKLIFDRIFVILASLSHGVSFKAAYMLDNCMP